jgi:hypothetical protein
VIDVLMPYAERVDGATSLLAPRLADLGGVTLGIVNNSWRCMHVISEEVQEVLRDYGVAGFMERRISAAQVLPDPQVEALAAECGAVVVGIGN